MNALHAARHITLALTLLAPSPLMATQEPPPGMTAQELADIQRRREVWFKDEMHTRSGAPHKMVEITFNRRGDSP